MSMPFVLTTVEMEIYHVDRSIVIVPRLLAKTESKRNVFVPSDAKSKPRTITELDFINAFSDAAGIDPDLTTEFVYSLAITNGIKIQVSPAELSFRFSLGGNDCDLFTFSIQNGHSSIYSMPHSIRQISGKHGAERSAVDQFFVFMRDYLDMPRCIAHPYEHTGRCFLRMLDTLEHADDFVDAVTDFIAKLKE